MSGARDPRLESVLQVRDPERRCRALIALIPDLSGDDRSTAIAAARAALSQIRDPARRTRLAQDLQGISGAAKGGEDDDDFSDFIQPNSDQPNSDRGFTSPGNPSDPFSHQVTQRDAEPRGLDVPDPQSGTAPAGAGEVPAAGSPPRGAKPATREPIPEVELGAREWILEPALEAREMEHRLPRTKPTQPTPDRRRSARPFVNLGFCDRAKPAIPRSPRRSLAAGAEYWFWVEIGERVRGSATDDQTRLDLTRLPPALDLTVVLFSNPGGLAVRDRIGRLHIAADRTIQVTGQPAAPGDGPLVSAELLGRRLFFAVTAPREPGTYRLRCCFYARGVLVQSHDVTATVEARSRAGRAPRVRSVLDYTLSSRLDPEALATHGEHRLSVLLNDDGRGTHSFRFFAPDREHVCDAGFSGGEIQDLVDRARGALRRVSWGTEAPWSEALHYRYAEQGQLAQLTADLAHLAIAGYQNYDAIIDRLGGEGGEDLAALMRRPGTIQLALKQHAGYVLPLALLYDHRLDVSGDPASFRLCEQFVRAQGRFAESACMRGDCPYRDRDWNRVVCPSGFWGFRHEIGVPPTLGIGAGSPSELPGVVACEADPLVVVSVSTDERMELRDQHVAHLRQRFGAASIRYAETREQTLALLRDARAHIVYFYGHGGVDRGAPYLQIGAPGEKISRATLRSEKVRWTEPRALVFLNGCHTTDLEPERAIDLVSGFVQTARGSGVIGTEITVFEPLATAFAEICLAELARRQTIGAAVRTARLRLLEDQWNPLGLVYIPYAIATLRLSPRA